MDNRLVDKASETKEIIDRALARMNTSIPGVIDSFDGETQTAIVIPAISMKTFIDDKEGVLEFPPIVNAPIVFPFVATAGFALTLPIRRGDPCIILFSQRSIDNWHDKGGIQPSEEGVAARHHDLTDAIILMAASPIPNVLGEWEGQGIQIRNRDKTSTNTLYDDKIVLDRAGTSTITVFETKVVIDTTVEVIIDTPETTITGNLTVNGNTAINGNTTVDGNTALGGNVTNVGVNISRTHVHSQGSDSDGNSQQDTQVPH